jgi:hypothetical protein
MLSQACSVPCVVSAERLHIAHRSIPPVFISHACHHPQPWRKSNANFWCEYCRVWMADNAQVRAIHEAGAKHKDNVAHRLREMRLKAEQEKKEQADTAKALQDIETEAKRQYEADRAAQERARKAKLGTWVCFFGKHCIVELSCNRPKTLDNTKLSLYSPSDNADTWSDLMMHAISILHAGSASRNGLLLQLRSALVLR